MSRVLGIDYGTVRTGIAITDELGITAQGLETITTNGSDKMLLKRLEEIISEYNVDCLVLGNPINMDGTKGKRAEETELFLHKLKSRFNKLKIVQIDERLTSVEAHKTMNFLDLNNKKKKQVVDALAAVYILEGYINKKA